MIEIKDLHKSYDDYIALKNINLTIKEGCIFGLVGRSGTGKSTLLRCINGLETFSQGEITVDDVEISKLSEKEILAFRKEIGMIFQQYSLLNRMTVYENIALPLRCWKYSEKEIDKKVKSLLEIIDLPEKIYNRPSELSGGQKQRVAIARALAMEPKVLLCDEATSALDPKSTQSILELLKDLNKNLGITIVVVTHEMPVVQFICDEIAILENKEISTIGKVETIFREKPQALINLVGDKRSFLPKQGQNLEIWFNEKEENEPIVTQMARQLNIDFTIVGTETGVFDDMSVKSVIVNIKNENETIIKDYLNSKKMIWSEIPSN